MLNALDEENDVALQELLEKLDKPVNNLFDERGFSLIHHAVLKQKHRKIQLLLNFAQLIQKVTKDECLEWINSKTKKDKFTPLHFASFKGKLDVIRVLIANGARLHERNEFGLTMLHVAA